MPLNDRKIKILNAIINDYITTAEPVGSRTIAKKYNLGVSSATIRNEMSDLEDMGYIVQPHASAGRIPSDLGYRFYVDRLMKNKELTQDDEQFLESYISRNISRIDYLMEETAKALSVLTNYTIITSEPAVKKTRLKQVRLIPLDYSSLMLVIATEENFIKNHIIRVKNAPDDEKVFEISQKLNAFLRGKTFEEINEDIIYALKYELREYSGIVEPVMKAIAMTVKASDNVHVHLSGAKNILTFPEFSDVQKAKSIFHTLEQKDVLISLLGDGIEDMQILIGNENNIKEMKECSVITTKYKVGKSLKGCIGVLGPTRMDYPQVIAVLNMVVKNIERVIKTLSGDNKS